MKPVRRHPAVGIGMILAGVLCFAYSYGAVWLIAIGGAIAGMAMRPLRRRGVIPQSGRCLWIGDPVARVMAVPAGVLLLALAWAWPDAALLTVVYVVGGALIVKGMVYLRFLFAKMPFQITQRPTVRFARLQAGAVLLGAVVLCAASVAAHIKTPRPDSFYHWDAPIPAEAGQLLRAEPIRAKLPANVGCWRILYTTTLDEADTPAVASAVVFAPLADMAAPLIAWAHGTTGIVSHAAPSVMLSYEALALSIPAFEAAMQNGWGIVATDYAGIGAEGVSPYLIGQGEARSVLDSLRAARQLRVFMEGKAAAAGETKRTDESAIPPLFTEKAVVWGHSQGGHAAMWTGILASAYAPDAGVLGIAAAAPATDLPALLVNSQKHFVGKALGAYALYAYAYAYPDVHVAEYIPIALWPVLKPIAHRAVGEPGILVSVVSAMSIRGAIYSRDPLEGAYGARLMENVPDAAINMPLFIAQGAADPLITQNVQDAFVARLRANGQDVAYAVYPGDHMTVLDAASGFPDALVAWTNARMAE